VSGGEEGKGGCVIATAVNSISPRDFFAAFALQGLVSYLGTHKIADQATDAYKLADAMMAERIKPPKFGGATEAPGTSWRPAPEDWQMVRHFLTEEEANAELEKFTKFHEELLRTELSPDVRHLGMAWRNWCMRVRDGKSKP